jgi:signal transduction histidine kinase
LSETVVRQTGWTNLPAARSWAEAERSGANLDGLRLHTEARLIGLHNTGTEWALELQTGLRTYQALVSSPENLAQAFPLGSLLQLSGVYALREGEGHAGPAAFALLLNSRADLQLLARPPWWTLRRLLLIVAALVAVLTGAAIWIKQLRKLVEQRTALLEREHARREHAERERAVESERARIAQDLHDDLGSSLSEIRVLASNGQRLPAADPRSPSLFQGITEKARSLIAALDVIVWAVDPEANSLQSLADYLAGYTTEYLATSHIICRFKIPVSLPSASLDGRARHDLFLAVKETLHNVVRHSGATQVEFQLATPAERVRIVIVDDGCGFDLEAARAKGHGLKNISERLIRSGGSCTIQSRPGAGTSVCIELQLGGPPAPRRT